MTEKSIQRIQGLVLLALLGAMAAGSGGCGATIVPKARLTDPVPVYVADYGIHSALFLPTTDGRYVEYAFGDWNYAVSNNKMPHDAIGALTVSFQAALGRRYLKAPADGSTPMPLEETPDSVQKIYCDRRDVYDLVKRLDDRYAAGLATARRNPDNGMLYVKDDEHYSLANNCNHLTARSLEELGCEIRGVVVSSSFRVEKPRKVSHSSTATYTPHVPGWTSVSVDQDF